MSKISVFDQSWIDMVFEGRNKSYGAYQLRQQDPRTTVTALFCGIALIVALISIPVVINYLKADITIDPAPLDTDGGITVVDIDPIIVPPKPDPIVPQKAGPAARQTQPTVAFKPLVASTTPPENSPTTTQVQTTNAGAITSAGTGKGIDIGPVAPDGVPAGTGTGKTPGTGEGTVEIMGTLDVNPAFPGGLNKFFSMVSDRFNVPEAESEKTMKVFVSFVVEKDGSMSNIKVTRDPYGLGKEALRVLNSIKTKWIPGMKNGIAVRTAYSLPITVNIK
jgi:protein TonB